jgi:transcriptional regulator with PAS, ATPase and Fis domain
MKELPTHFSAANAAVTQLNGPADAVASDDLDLLVGTSAPIAEVRRLIERVAPTDSTVLIIGESGSGKELVAQAIHALSQRHTGPFITINCAAIPANLVEAELFGYERGSFTGAVRSHSGVFERAHGGTLFLDEITEMPLELQSRLLRVLESKRLSRVGGAEEMAVDVRLIAATNRSPIQASKDGALREDILYRLAVFPICVPPLRDRDSDVQLLIDHFLQQLNDQYDTEKSLAPELCAAFQRHSWPGNVRELRNAVERAFILADKVLQVPPLDLAMSNMVAANQSYATADMISLPIGSKLADAERLLIETTLRQCNGNKRRTADLLGCSLKTLYNKLHAYGATTPRASAASKAVASAIAVDGALDRTGASWQTY